MPELEDAAITLAALIDADDFKERECRDFLKYAKAALVNDNVIEFLYVEQERRGYAGDSDYVFSCRIKHGAGAEYVRAYIWELKAPQCYIFEKDTEHRLRPTKELIDAENKLLNYYHEHKGSELFRNTFRVTQSTDIRLGGIIIGCNNRRVQGDYEMAMKNKLYQDALTIRQTYLYDPAQFKIVNWNFIHDFIKPLDPSRIVLSTTGPSSP